MPLDLGLIDGDGWDAAALDAIEAYINALAVGLSKCTSGTRPGSPAVGDAIFETDTSRIRVWYGSVWHLVYGLMGLEASSPTATLPNSATTDLEWATESYDADGGFTAGTAAYTCPEDGVWAVLVKLTSAGGQMDGGLGSNIEIVASGVAYRFPINNAGNSVAALTVSVASGQTIYARVENGTGASITDLAGTFNIRFVGR